MDNINVMDSTYQPFADYFGLNTLLRKLAIENEDDTGPYSKTFSQQEVRPLQWQSTGLHNSMDVNRIMNLSKVYADRGSRKGTQRKKPVSHCVFCKNNGELSEVYESHTCKDVLGNITTCPILRAYTCPICGSTGDNAHTIKYCPRNADSNITAVGTSLRTPRASNGVKRY